MQIRLVAGRLRRFFVTREAESLEFTLVDSESAPAYAECMAVQAVTVNLPDPLYERLARRASKSHRTVEAEIVDAVSTSLPTEPDELPADMAEALAALHLLDDEDLWRAARQRLAAEKAAKIEEIHLKRQSEGLSALETDALVALMKEYTRIMLVRSRSAALLKQRGHDVSGLLEGNEP